MTTILTILAVLIGIVFLLFLADAWTRARIRRLQRRGLYPLEGEETDTDVERLIRLSRRMEAIRVYRAVHGGDLKSAREAVDRLAGTLRPWRRDAG